MIQMQNNDSRFYSIRTYGEVSSVAGLGKSIAFVLLAVFCFSTSLFSDDNEDSLEGIVLRFIKQYTLQEKYLQEKEVSRLHHSVIGPYSGELIGVSATKLARFYKNTNPKLAFQYLKIANERLVQSPAARELIQLELADLYQQGGFYSEANAILSTLKVPRDTQERERFLRLRVLVLSRSEQHYSATQFYKQYAKEMSMRKMEDKLLHALSVSFKVKKEKKLEFQALEELASRHPFSLYSEQALATLKEYAKNSRENYYFSQYVLRKLKLHASVNEPLEASLIEFLDLPVYLNGRPIRVLNSLQKMELAMSLNLDDQAFKIMSGIQEKEGKLTPGEAAEFQMLKARWYARDGDYWQALDLYENHAKTASPYRNLNSLQSRMAWLHQDLGDFYAAAEVYSAKASRTRSTSDRWHHFWSLYRAGKYDLAYKKLTENGYVKGHDYPRSSEENIYWEARLLEKLGRFKESAHKYDELLARYSQSYYAIVLKSRMRRHADRMQKQKKISGTFPKILSEWAVLKNNKMPKIFAALAEPKTILPEDSYGQDQGVEHLLKFIDHSITLKDSSKVIASIEDKIYERFPKAFQKIVDPLAETLDVDKYLIYSFMKTESEFNKSAISWVGAIGLMQIMPYTGYKIAREIGDPRFDVTRLRDPAINIAYAQYYVRRLIEHFEGNVLLAVAAYNAGPEAVHRWVENCAPCEMDEFVESITYRETRQYVKKMVGTLATYKSFYEGELPSLPWSILGQFDPNAEIF